MFGLFRQNRVADDIAARLYGAIVAQARTPALYASLGAPDTLEGRFEMVILHATLALRRLRAEGEKAKAIGQAVFDAFCADMDRSLRSIGVGDLGMAKRMRKMGEAFYGRAAAYDAALDAGDRAALADALARNALFGAGGTAAAGLADYVAEANARLGLEPSADVLGGTLAFADPSVFARAGVA